MRSIKDNQITYKYLCNDFKTINSKCEVSQIRRQISLIILKAALAYPLTSRSTLALKIGNRATLSPQLKKIRCSYSYEKLIMHCTSVSCRFRSRVGVVTITILSLKMSTFPVSSVIHESQFTDTQKPQFNTKPQTYEMTRLNDLVVLIAQYRVSYNENRAHSWLKI